MIVRLFFGRTPLTLEFSIQAVNFLNAMARDVDFDKLEPAKMPFKGPQGGHKSPFAFDPMRRKAHVFDSACDQ
jgi:hypothetical protein